VEVLQARVQRDEGRRGIKGLVQPGQLLAAARTAVHQPKTSGVLLLTGFPCLRERSPPIETDGPPGAVALAYTLLALFRNPVTILIEDHSANALQRCAEVGNYGAVPELAAFPTSDRWTAADDARLEALRMAASTVVSIERAGDSRDGTCYTMRGLPMGASLLGRINQVATPGQGQATIAIGDGGNELGLGSMHAQICETIPRGEQIGCVVPADAPLVASVSNWGGYALSCAMALLAWDAGLEHAIFGSASQAETPEAYLFHTVQDRRLAEATIHACNDEGVVDGITGEAGGSVDGMTCETHLALFDELRGIALAALQASPRGAGTSATSG